MADDDPSTRVPPTLVRASGITWRILILLAGLVVIGYVLNIIFPVVLAFFLSLLVTALAEPVMRLFARIMPKVLAMILSLLLIITAIVTILFIVIRSTIAESSKLVSSLQSGLTEIRSWLKDGPLGMTDQSVNNLISQAESWGSTAAKGALSAAAGELGNLGTVIIGGSVFIFGVIFFLLTPDRIWNWVIGWLPATSKTPVDVSGRIVWHSISGYTKGIVVIALADATLVFIGLTILQVPLAPALAAVVFLGAFIPVIGAPIATFFAAVVALAERGPIIALLVIVLTVIVGSADGHILQPLVMGKAVNLHPLAIIFAIAAGSIALGIVGALVAVPVAAAIYGVAKYVTGRDPERPWPPPVPEEQSVAPAEPA
jgi:predicted PurR-regulated permease PerM